MNSENQTGNGKGETDTGKEWKDFFNNVVSDIRATFKKVSGNRRIAKAVKGTLITLALISSAVFVIVFFLFLAPGIQELFSGKKSMVSTNTELTGEAAYKKQVTTLNRDIQRLSKKYSSFTSGNAYIVINTTDNRFFLYRNKQLVREGFCSSGSYTKLQGEGDKHWIFKTPKGKYQILGKTTSPVWRKPDWAFVEEGLPIPSGNDPSRWEYGVLGDYALSIGDGYLIHGTIYKRFLGMPVTHGCIRLNDEDLEAIYKTLNIGSRVYIF